jgi:hypothetical protein
MKHIAASAVVILLCSNLAIAQILEDKPASAQPAEITLVTGNESKHAREADARHCLDRKDNAAIIRCAEKYLRIPIARK